MQHFWKKYMLLNFLNVLFYLVRLTKLISILSAIFLKNVGSRMHKVTQNLVGDWEMLVISMPGKEVLACTLLRKNFLQNDVPSQKYP
jgi:hypothetical protein